MDPTSVIVDPAEADLGDAIERFVEDFLRPVCADKILDQHEESPLMLAFAVWLDEHVLPWPDLIQDLAHRCLLRLEEPPPLCPYTPDQVWQSLLDSGKTALFTRNDLSAIREWLKVSPSAPSDPLFDPYPSTPNGVPIQTRTRFYTFLKEVKAELSSLEHPGEALSAGAQEALEEILTQRIAPPPLPLPPWRQGAVTFNDCPQVTQETFEVGRQGLLARAPLILDRMEERLRGDLLGLAFDERRSGPEHQVLRVPELPSTHLWFVGDLHGDLLALEAALASIEDLTPSEEVDAARIVFLGDLVDRGSFNLEVVLRVMELMVEHPERICLLLGNHEDGLSIDSDGCFKASVQPADFVDFLNQHITNPESLPCRTGRLLVELTRRLPRALLLPNGLLVSHGGIPHTDLHASLTSWSDLEAPTCRQDFVWTRAHDTAPRKIPNRRSRGCEFGVKDFDAFCDRIQEVTGHPIRGILRGHTHATERFAQPAAYLAHPLLTLNSLCRRQPDELFGDYIRTACIARYQPDSMPDVTRIRLSESTVRAVYPEETA